MMSRQILKELDEKEKSTLHRLEGCTWHPEYGSWMIEATPRQPFSGYAADLVRVRVCGGVVTLTFRLYCVVLVSLQFSFCVHAT